MVVKREFSMKFANNKTRTHTFRTRFISDRDKDVALERYAELFSHTTHSLFASLHGKESRNEIKRRFIREFGITGRQFNSCRIELEGMTRSIIARMSGNIELLDTRIKKLSKRIPRLKNPQAIVQKKRKLERLIRKRDQLVSDKKNNTVRLCFGSKKLFRKQFSLEENGYNNHEEWRQDWQKSRRSRFFIVGSKDETSGNQTCTATAAEDDSLTLRLRLPNALSEHGKYLYIPNVHFAYGHGYILDALASKQAISYRFVEDEKGWEVFASVELPEPEWLSNERKGAIGVDLNVDHFAVVDMDRSGNPLNKYTITLGLRSKSNEQRAAIIGDACAKVVGIAKDAAKPLIIEHLEFSKKKVEENSIAGKRMIHSFAYSIIAEILRSRAWRNAIEVHSVKSAYTSVIGQVKFKNKYGLSVHHAAALCIARRFYGFSEQPTHRFVEFTNNKGARIVFSLPVRNRGKHVWCLWSKIVKKIQAVYKAHYWTNNNRSLGPPLPAHAMQFQ